MDERAIPRCAYSSIMGRLPLPRSSREQSRIGTLVGYGDLEPGDLVFYNTRNRPYSHVGIYLANGRFIHAPRPRQRVRVGSLQSSYWRARFNGARRLEPRTISDNNSH